MFNSIQFVESLKARELPMLAREGSPSASAFALCATFESLMWFVCGVDFEYFDRRNATEIIAFYFRPLLSRLVRQTSEDETVLRAVLMRQGVALGRTRQSPEYGIIRANLPAFEPQLAAFVTERSPFSRNDFDNRRESDLSFESAYVSASLFNTDIELQLFLQMANFSSDPEWQGYVAEQEPEEIAAHIVSVLEYTLDQKQILSDRSSIALRLDSFVKSVQGWRMCIRSRFSAERLSSLATILDRKFDFSEQDDNFGSFDEAVKAIRGFWQQYRIATA